jgi:hypothetical protein
LIAPTVNTDSKGEFRNAIENRPISAVFLFFGLFSPEATSRRQTPLDSDAYRGMIVCEKAPGAADILRVPLDLAVRGNGSGSVDGKVQMASTWGLVPAANSQRAETKQ